MEYSAVLWQCRRGLKELDVLLEPYCISQYKTLDTDQQALFVELLTHEDIDLYDWFFTEAPAPSEALSALIERIKHKDN